MITTAKQSSILQGFPKYRSMLAGNSAYAPPGFESIATATGTGASGTITFSSIPTNYTHLHIRGNIQSSTGQSIIVRLNGDTAGNYTYHTTSAYKYSTNPATISNYTGSGAQTWMIVFSNVGTSSTTSTPSPFLMDVFDYLSTSKFKTARYFCGTETNATTNYETTYGSGMWRSTAAVNSITLALGGGNFTTNTTFSLYGIKASA